MTMQRLVLAITIVTACVAALPNVFQWEIASEEKLLSKLKTRAELMDYLSEGRKATQKPIKLKDFSFTDCGGPNAMVNVASLVVSPDPLAFPGPLNVAASFKINKNLNQPLKGDVTIAKKILGKFVKIPCIDNFGSCVYPDLCQLLEQVQCPDPIVKIGIDCRCPLKASAYTLPKTQFSIDASVIPAGDYNIQANVTYTGQEAACLQNAYTIPKLEIEVQASIIPSGDYIIAANVTHKGHDAACLHLSLKVE